MTSTTYLGWSQGANEANTEVAFLPNSWAVPVLPATQTLSRGKPPKAPAAVPWVTTPASALRMYASVPRDTGRCLITGGLRSEEHTSELQSRSDLVCRLLLEKKKKQMIGS